MAFVPKRTKDKEPAGYKSLYIKEKLIKEVEKIAKENEEKYNAKQLLLKKLKETKNLYKH